MLRSQKGYASKEFWIMLFQIVPPTVRPHRRLSIVPTQIPATGVNLMLRHVQVIFILEHALMMSSNKTNTSLPESRAKRSHLQDPTQVTKSSRVTLVHVL